MFSVAQKSSSILLAFLLGCESIGAPVKIRSVEVFISGSDIETPENNATIELRDALEGLVASRPDLALSKPGRGDINIIIPVLVRIRPTDDGGVVSFSAEIEGKHRVTEAINGACKRRDIATCAAAILRAVPR
jgi:hypothetical protein